VLDLSQVYAIEGGGLGMLLFLKRWAQDHDIGFKLFNPSKSVRHMLKQVSAMSEFDIPKVDEMKGSPGRADRRYADLRKPGRSEPSGCLVFWSGAAVFAIAGPKAGLPIRDSAQ
jgi:hypothetical protein